MAISSSATGLRPGVCTSTTRPTAPYTGQIIYQTDDGQMLVWNGSSWGSLNPTANRNALINGAFDVWQRGTSFAAPANLTYTADRWFSTWGSAARTVSRQAGFSNAQYCARVQRDSGSTSAAYTGINQIIESANCYQFQGKTVTLSFDARCGANYSSSGSTLLVYLQSGTASDQGSSSLWSGWTGIAAPISTSVVLTTTAQRFTLTGTVASNALELAVTFQYLSAGTAGAADYFEVTNVQLEVGNQASAFERRSYGTELALCQRYYEHNYGTGYAVGSAPAYPYNQPQTAINGYTTASQQKFTYSIYMVPKRRVPDITIYDMAGNNGKLTTLDAGGTGTNNVTVGISSTSDKMIGYAPSAGTYAGYAYFYVASAEL